MARCGGQKPLFSPFSHNVTDWDCRKVLRYISMLQFVDVPLLHVRSSCPTPLDVQQARGWRLRGSSQIARMLQACLELLTTPKRALGKASGQNVDQAVICLLQWRLIRSYSPPIRHGPHNTSRTNHFHKLTQQLATYIFKK